MREVTDSDGTVLHVDFVTDWDALFQGRGEKRDTHAGLRKTKNSRRPKGGNEGVIRARVLPLGECVHCGGVRLQYVEGSPHAPRGLKVDGRWTLVDCVGAEVAP